VKVWYFFARKRYGRGVGIVAAPCEKTAHDLLMARMKEEGYINFVWTAEKVLPVLARKAEVLVFMLWEE
jgi:hypothetical protein